MPRLFDWPRIREDFETGKLTNVELSKKYGPRPATISAKSRAEHWLSPKKLARKAKYHVKQRETKEEFEARVLAEVEEKYQAAKEAALAAGVEGLEAFHQKKHVPKDFHEADKAFSLVQRATGNEDNSPKIGLNIALLSTPQSAQDRW